MRTSLRVMFVLVTALYAAPTTAAPILSLVPSSSTVVVGDTFSVDVVVTGAQDLFAFQFDLGFSPSILSAISIAEGSFLSDADATFFIPGSIDNSGGLISFTANSLLTAIAGVNGSGTIATMTFSALAAGSSPISLFNVTLLDSSLSGIATTFQAGQVVVSDGPTDPTPVPEPSTLLLLSSALMVGVRRIRRRAREMTI